MLASLPLDLRAAAERCRQAFVDNFQDGVEVGAGVAIWEGDTCLLSACSGFSDVTLETPWEEDTLVLVWSATKGMAAACVLHALESNNLSPLTKISSFWPGFARNGKENLTVADALCHRAGLSALENREISILDHDAVVAALETQQPLWPAKAAHGYSPRIFGFLADEFVRCLTGETLGNYWLVNFKEPMDLSFWIGLPEELNSKVAQMLPPKLSRTTPRDSFLQAMNDPESLTRAAFSSPLGLGSVSAMNTLEARTASLPALGGIGTPSSMAKFYSMLACGGEWQGQRFFRPETLQWMRTRLVNGFDKTILMDSAFSVGFMMDPVGKDGRKTRSLFGPTLAAFGHPGAGGSMGFADPAHGIGFAYVMNQMEIGVMPNRRAQNLVNAFFTP